MAVLSIINIQHELLIYEIRICLESDLQNFTFYQVWPLLSIKSYKIIDSILYFFYNSTKHEYRSLVYLVQKKF
jgi:hypothetical protein